jgi:tRNA uridine 5-carbamoylmethylation protein Kti12
MIVLVGPPSVGKSTWIKSNFPNAYIINRDDIVDKVASSYGWTYDDMFATPPADAQVGDSDEKFGNVVAAPSWMTWAKTIFDKVQEANGKVQQLMNSKVSGANPSNQDIVVDMTNMNAGSRKSAMKAIEGNEDKYHKVAVDFKFKGAEDVIKKMADKRAEAAQRMGKSKTIPPAAFDRMFSSYEEPTTAEGFDEVISVDNIENLKRALNDDSENLSESIIKIVRESVNNQ